MALDPEGVPRRLKTALKKGSFCKSTAYLLIEGALSAP
jgi:hypothetical protein